MFIQYEYGKGRCILSSHFFKNDFFFFTITKRTIWKCQRKSALSRENVYTVKVKITLIYSRKKKIIRSYIMFKSVNDARTRRKNGKYSKLVIKFHLGKFSFLLIAIWTFHTHSCVRTHINFFFLFLGVVWIAGPDGRENSNSRWKMNKKKNSTNKNINIIIKKIHFKL